MRIRESRGGVSLAEVVVVIALLGVIGGAISSALLHQQRFAGDTADLLDARNGVRDAIEVVSTDIRGSATADTIRLMADSAIELFASIGTSVVCRATAAASFALAEESARGNTLSSYLVQPDTGDLALIYSDSADASGSRWKRHRIAGFATIPAGPSCLPDGVGPKEGFVLTIHTPPDPPVRQGAPVRFVRRGRHSLYRSSDRAWYLGYRRCNALGASACGGIQPVSGPHGAYSADTAETGLLFNYFDARGAEVPDAGSPLSVARVEITARAERRRRRLMSNPTSAVPPVARRSIAIRNR